MITYEDQCVGCPPELGCIGDLCCYKNVPVYYCDKCNDYAQYILDGHEYCEDCFEAEVKAELDNYSMFEIAKLLDMNCTIIEE